MSRKIIRFGKRKRAKEEEEEEERKLNANTISSEHFIKLDSEKIEQQCNDKHLPYLKCIELPKLAPHQFQLDKWKPSFILPNSWMKRIYKNDVYHDTDLPVPEPETISPSQKKILNDYVDLKRKHDHLLTQTKTRQQPQPDCLLECLAKPYGIDPRREVKPISEKDLAARRQIIQGQPLSLLNGDNIAICSKHKVQPEGVIVKLALEKMKMLSVEEELRYQALLKNQEFMRVLNSRVENYLRKLQVDSHVLSNEQQQQQQQPTQT